MLPSQLIHLSAEQRRRKVRGVAVLENQMVIAGSMEGIDNGRTQISILPIAFIFLKLLINYRMQPFRELAFCLPLVFVISSTFCQEQPGVWGVVGSSTSLKTTWLYSEYHKNTGKLNFATAIVAYDNSFFIIGDTSYDGRNRGYVVIMGKTIYLMEPKAFANATEIDEGLIKAKTFYPDFETRKNTAIYNMSQYLAEQKARLDLEREQQEFMNQRIQDSINKKDQRDIDSLKKLIDKSLVMYREKNWVLWTWSFGYSNEYSKFVDVDITVINPYKKKIKYIWFTLIAFNPVGDPVRHGINGKSEITVQGVGPIEYAAKGTYNFEDVFYSSVIETMRVKQIKIQFFDGTYKIIANPKDMNAE